MSGRAAGSVVPTGAGCCELNSLAPAPVVSLGPWQVFAESLSEDDEPVTSAASALALPASALFAVANPSRMLDMMAYLPVGLSLCWTGFQVYTGSRAFIVADHVLGQVEQVTTNLISVHAVHAEHLTEEWHDGCHSVLRTGFQMVEWTMSTFALMYATLSIELCTPETIIPYPHGGG